MAVRLVRLLLAVASGLIMWLCFTPLGFWPLYVVALGIFAYNAFRARPWEATGLGFVTGLSCFLPTIYWAAISTQSHFAWVLLSVIESLYWAAVSGLTSAVRRRLWAPVMFAALWAGFEQFRGVWPLTGFPWATTAMAVVPSGFSHLLPVGGASLVALVVALVSVFLVGRQRRGLTRVLVSGAAFVVLIGAMLWFGPSRHIAPVNPVKVAIVQGGISRPWQADFQQRGRVVARTVDTAAEGAAKDPAQLYLAGETALDHDPRQFRDVSLKMQELPAGPFVAGTNRYFVAPGRKLMRYNQMLVWQGGRVQGETYSKRYPVPYGEYIPFKNVAKMFADVDKLLSTEVQAGTDANVMRVILEDGREVSMSVGICYEVAYERLIADGVAGGGQFIFIPTNNASFGDSWESWQQIQLLRVRAKETHRWGVQVSINGKSAVVNPAGYVTVETGLNTADYVTAQIGTLSDITYAVRFREQLETGFLALAAIGSLISLVVGMLDGRRQSGSRAARREK